MLRRAISSATLGGKLLANPTMIEAMTLKNALSCNPKRFHACGERGRKAVGHQNPQERTDQRGADLFANLGWRAVDVPHRDHDAEHRRDDAEARAGRRPSSAARASGHDARRP